MVCWFLNIFFLSYYFFEFDEFIFSFQNIYKQSVEGELCDDFLIHLDLWLKIGLFDGPGKNPVIKKILIELVTMFKVYLINKPDHETWLNLNLPPD